LTIVGLEGTLSVESVDDLLDKNRLLRDLLLEDGLLDDILGTIGVIAIIDVKVAIEGRLLDTNKLLEEGKTLEGGNIELSEITGVLEAGSALDEGLTEGTTALLEGRGRVDGDTILVRGRAAGVPIMSVSFAEPGALMKEV